MTLRPAASDLPAPPADSLHPALSGEVVDS
jgi:hypothetical protein